MTAVNWSNVTSLTDLPSLANTTTGGSFWLGMLQMIFIVSLLIMIPYGFEVALMSSAFIGLVLAFLLVYSDLLAWTWVLQFAGILLAIFLYIIFSNNRER